MARRTALSAPGGGTRVGEQLTRLPLTLYSDPFAPELECSPFVAAGSSSETVSVFDNGMDIARVDWIREGVIENLVYPRATATEFDAPVTVENDVNLMTLSEFRRFWPDVGQLLFIKAGTGIGSGIITDGRIYRGAQGAARFL